MRTLVKDKKVKYPVRTYMEFKRSIKIVKLIVKNYRGIGPKGLEIDIDDIVVLVGPNNSGKSTILKAFELVTKADTDIKLDDFYKKVINNKPEIEVWSKILSDDVNIDKKLWVDNDNIVKERWSWVAPDTKAERVGYRVDKGWSKMSDEPRAPFGNDGAAASAYRPAPTYITPFDDPIKQIEEIKKIISTEIYESIKNEKRNADDSYKKLLSKIRDLQTKIRIEAKGKEDEISNELEVILSSLFTGTKITLDVLQNNPDILSSFAIAKDINFKIDDLSLENQGSGMQRALLWSVLKMLASRKRKNNQKIQSKKSDKTENLEFAERSKVLLMDEPEICLHPESIRQAKDILYGLAANGEWQIMITTHSPIFIDLSKDNTNIIRVHKDEGEVSFFKTNESRLSLTESEQLKMLNMFDPYFAEFFFARTVIVVEGDTEYTAFRKIITLNKEKFKDIHIVRARGKYTILPIVKILTKWGKNFSILHDSDSPDNKQSWPANKKILDIVLSKSKKEINIKLLACKNNFESAFFKQTTNNKDKPFNAYIMLDNKTIFDKVNSVFEYLCNEKDKLDSDDIQYVCEYKSVEELEKFLK